MTRTRIPAADRFEKHVDRSGECWLWTAARNHKGYGLFRDDDHRQVSTHRWAYQAFIGPIPAGAHIMHTCDQPGCVRPEHLVAGDNHANMADKVAKGRQYKPTGERHHCTHLTDGDVRAIRAATNTQGRVLAEMYGVSPSTISQIRHRKQWAHVR